MQIMGTLGMIPVEVFGRGPPTHGIRPIAETRHLGDLWFDELGEGEVLRMGR